MQKAVAILWPSFLVAGVATILFSTLIDPDILIHGLGLEVAGRLAIYSIAWLGFWLMGIVTAGLTCFFLNPLK